MKKSFIPKGFQVTFIALLILMLYAVALIFPGSWWGLHYPAFLSDGKGWLLVLAVIGFTLFSQKYNLWESLKSKENLNYGWLWILGISMLFAIIFHNLPIYEDSYGDALKVLPDRTLMLESFDGAHKEKLFEFDFTNPKLGTGTTFAVVAWISYVREIPVYDAFRLLGSVCGFGFVFFMLSGAYRIARNNQQRLLFTLLVVGTPLTQAFCGHIEIYAPVFLMLAVFWYVVIRFLAKPSILMGVILCVLCLLNLKFHITGIMTPLIVILVILSVIGQKKGIRLTSEQIGYFILAPIIAIGMFVYVFVTKSVYGPRSFDEGNIYDPIFLPIKSSDPAPFDRYNLFSWNHFFDYFNMTFLWSGLAIIIVITALIFKRKQIDWSKPLVQVSGVSLICYVLLFFVFNPLLTMPNDWDIMSIPAVALIVFTMSLITAFKHQENTERSFTSYLMAPGFGLLLIAYSGHWVNANQASLSNRLMAIGKQSYKTYWIGTSTSIIESVRLMEDDEERKRALVAAVDELKAYQVKGEDPEFASIQHHLGLLYQKENKMDLAYHQYRNAFESNPYLTVNVEKLYQMLQYKFINKEFDDALEIAKMLVEVNYPTQRKSLRVAIHTALEAEAYQAAEKYCQQLLKANPNDQFIREILGLLKDSEDKASIKLRFRQS